MKGPTQVKNLLHVLFVTKFLEKIQKGRGMKGITQVKNLLHVLFVKKKIFRKVKHEMTRTGEKTLSMSFMCHYV